MKHSNYYSWGNSNYGDLDGGRPGRYSANLITTRGADIYESIPTTKPSRNIAQAHVKALKLFRRISRMMPFFLRINLMLARINPIQANLNIAKLFREKAHLRDPHLVDQYITKGYERIYETEFHITPTPTFVKFVCPESTFKSQDRGYSYLEERKFSNKSKFLKEFYLGNRPSY